MAPLIVGTLIGSGGYGQVYRAKWEERIAAIKKIPLTQDEVRQAGALQQEIDSLQRLVDRHVIQFYGTTFHEGQLVVVMDYAEGGSLHRAIEEGRVVDWSTKTRIAEEIVQGLAYIHYKDVLHLNLKSKNVLLTRHMEVKLSDFGLSTVKIQSASKSASSRNGTLRWMAPELLTARPMYSTKSDMYALGMVMWELAANCTIPFKGQLDNLMVISLVRSGEREELPDDTPLKYREWVEKCWDQDPTKRPDAKEMAMKDHEFAGGSTSRASGSDGNGNIPDILSILFPTLTTSIATHAPPSVETIKMLSMPYDSSEVKGDSFMPAALPTITSMVPTLPSTKAARETSKSDGDGEIRGSTSDKAPSPTISCTSPLPSSNENTTKKLAESVGDTSVKGGVSVSAPMSTTSCTTSTSPSKESPKNPGEVTTLPGVDFDSLLRRSHAGDLEAQIALATRYEKGIGVTKSPKKAFKWYLHAAQLGSLEGQFRTGDCFNNSRGTAKDHKAAADWLRKAAERGHKHAQNELGWMYQNGIGVQQDYGVALPWYRKSAEQGHAPAQKNLGSMYHAGYGVAKDYSKALSWYLKAAKQGNSAAQQSAGWMYQVGLGVKRDYAKALSLYLQSAEQGNVVAQKNLGWMYENGHGVNQDYSKAMSWYRKAAEQGNVSAQNGLTRMKQIGLGF
ncbi:hypothetical protein BGZ73_001666 [Actinomortierella ambigua]|nr:hypothetical protein BGZ73_001666 [Actinomortierella ambigua]